MSKARSREALGGAFVVVSLVIALGGCSTAVHGTPYTKPGLPPVTSEPTAPDTDAQVCGDLERLGRTFYTSTFAPMLMQQGQRSSLDVVPIQLSGQLAVLTAIGAPAGETDGTLAISNTSPPVRTAMISMVRDADRLAQKFADASASGVMVGSDVTPVLTSFSGALVACTESGHQPAWFDPAALADK